jgi:GntR family transcriptional repressor for pyruvate dehydrogenase complex
LDHLFEIRLLLEPPAAALATRRAANQEIKDLENLLIQTEKVKDDALGLRNGNLEFHRRLVSLAGNPLLTALCQTVLKLLVESMQHRLDLSISLSVLSFHWLVLKAVRERKPELAQRLLTEDLGVLHAKYQELNPLAPLKTQDAQL